MNDKLYTIGKISVLTNVSIDQLRNYDKIGLLKPEGRGSNNYRHLLYGEPAGGYPCY